AQIRWLWRLGDPRLRAHQPRSVQGPSIPARQTRGLPDYFVIVRQPEYGCTVDTTTGGRAYVTCTTLRPRRPDGRRSRRRDRLLRGAGPTGRGQDVRRGRVLGHGLRH